MQSRTASSHLVMAAQLACWPAGLAEDILHRLIRSYAYAQLGTSKLAFLVGFVLLLSTVLRTVHYAKVLHTQYTPVLDSNLEHDHRQSKMRHSEVGRKDASTASAESRVRSLCCDLLG